MNPVKYIPEDDFNNCVKNPVIIHYLGEKVHGK